ARRYQTDGWDVRWTDPRRGRTLKRRGVAQERLDVRVALAGLDAVELHEVRHAADVFDVKRLNACGDSVGHQEVELRQLDRNAGRQRAAGRGRGVGSAVRTGPEQQRNPG